MIMLKNITKIFHHRVLDNISCTINEGDFITIVGSNGSGKTTLFDIIAGKTIPDSGKVFLHDQDINKTTEQERANWIARLLQDPKANTIDHMTVEQNIAMATFKNRTCTFKAGLSALPTETIERIKHEHDINLEPLLHKKMSSLSGGQRQLIAFIMATIIPPELLLLDEPTAALDPKAATTLLTCVNSFIQKHNVTTLLITHDPNIALILGNKTWTIEEGTLKTFDQEEKKNLSAQKLIGNIDYHQVTNNA